MHTSLTALWGTLAHNLLTVYHLFNATYVVFPLALTQHTLCHYTRHMFMNSFSYVLPHVTVLSNEYFTEVEQQTRDTSARSGGDGWLLMYLGSHVALGGVCERDVTHRINEGYRA